VITALIIFIITYIFIGLRQIPRVHIDRPAGALVGAVLMIAFGALTLDQAFAAINMHTLLLLLGMMIITVYLRSAGFFELMAGKILSLSKTPPQLLIFVTVSSGLLSALFVNDTICLLFTPIILEVTVQLGVNPMQYLLALAMSSTLAGNLTLIGSVPNLIVAQQARRKVEIGFMEYFRVGALITAATIVIGVLVLAVEVKIANSAEVYAAETKTKQMAVTFLSGGHAAGRRTFTVALMCDTDESRAKGLQGFRTLQTKEAALFVFDRPEAVTFWMGSVTFPIDIIFVSPNGYVVEVSPHCQPGSHQFYGSGIPVKWVVETAAGSGIMVGDRVVIK
jgi:uncharacterized membrane protein (UPF0127 family)